MSTRIRWGLMLVLGVGLVGTGAAMLYGVDAPAGLPTTAPTQAQILRGRYLVTAVAACADCHSATVPDQVPSGARYLAGYVPGAEAAVFTLGRYKVYGANITPDNDTGIGKWTPQQVFNALRIGKDDEGHYLAPVMPYHVYRNMSDADTWAIVAYLTHVRPVRNAVPETEGPNRPDWAAAAQAYPVLPPFPAQNEVPAM